MPKLSAADEDPPLPDALILADAQMLKLRKLNQTPDDDDDDDDDQDEQQQPQAEAPALGILCTYDMKKLILVLAVFVVLDHDPKTRRTVLRWVNWHKGQDAERERAQNGTWVLVEATPHLNVLDNRWVYKTKLKADGTIERFKAGLVAKGF